MIFLLSDKLFKKKFQSILEWLLIITNTLLVAGFKSIGGYTNIG